MNATSTSNTTSSTPATIAPAASVNNNGHGRQVRLAPTLARLVQIEEELVKRARESGLSNRARAWLLVDDTADLIVEIADGKMWHLRGIRTFISYAKAHLPWRKAYLERIVTCARLVKRLPPLPAGSGQWTLGSVFQLQIEGGEEHAVLLAGHAIDFLRRNPSRRMSWNLIAEMAAQHLPDFRRRKKRSESSANSKFRRSLQSHARFTLLLQRKLAALPLVERVRLFREERDCLAGAIAAERQLLAVLEGTGGSQSRNGAGR